MKLGKPKLFAYVAVCVCVVAAIAFGIISYGNSTVYRTMTKGETERCDQLAVSVYKTGVISPVDLNWALRMLQTPSWTGEPLQTQQRHLEVMVALKNLRTLAPGQKEQLYQATVDFLTGPSPQERIGAMAVMRVTKDKRAIPAVTALLNDRDKFTREMARKTLNVLSA